MVPQSGSEQQIVLRPDKGRRPAAQDPAQAVVQVPDRSIGELPAIEDAYLRLGRADGQQAGAHLTA
jgi:hypothetical protein